MNDLPRKRRAYTQPDPFSVSADQFSPYPPPPPPNIIPDYLESGNALRHRNSRFPPAPLTVTIDLAPSFGPVIERDLAQRYSTSSADSHPNSLHYAPQQQGYHIVKRPRLNTNCPMASSHSTHPSTHDGQEKPHIRGELSSRSDAVSGWNLLKQCMCALSDDPPPAHPPMHPPYYDCYGPEAPPMLVNNMASFQPQSPVHLASSQISSNSIGMPPCTEVDWQRMATTYPALQPIRIAGFQSQPSKEEMIYPTLSAYGMPPQPCVTSPSIKSETDSGAFFVSSDHSSPYEQHHPQHPQHHQQQQQHCDGFSSLPMPAQYQKIQGYGVREADEQHLAAQGDSPVPDTGPKGPSKRKAFSDPELRAKTAQTRKLGSCIRCRMQRIRCILDEGNESGPCIPCKRSMSNSRVWRFDCFRRKIPDVKLYKPGQVPGFEWTNRWKGSVVDAIDTWVDPKARKFIWVTEGYTVNEAVKLLVNKFVPQAGDKLERSWVDSSGKKQTRSIAPYAIADMEGAKRGFNEYISRHRCLATCCKTLMGTKALLYSTYSIAIRKAFLDPEAAIPVAERNLLVKTLTLWMSIRMTTKSFKIVGGDMLGMPHNIINDSTQELDGSVPIPPVMGAQIDMILIHEIQPQLRRVVLDELQKMVLEKKPGTWLTTYLVSFILLHNAALITDHDAKYAIKHGMNRRFARENDVRDYNSGATTLLAYFHYVNRGVYPFSEDCKDTDLSNLAELDAEEIKLVHLSRQFAAEKKAEWENLWADRRYEDEYYYLSQLFEQDWKAKSWEA